MNKHIKSFFFVAILFAVSCKNDNSSSSEETTTENALAQLNYKIVGESPHDINSFTEGLYMLNGQLFESTGSPDELPQTQSHFGIVDTTSGKIKVKATIDKKLFFGEGISEINGKIYQLTYTTQTCFVYDAKTFKQIGKFSYPNTEGWGLTNDGKNLIMSDGTFKLTYINPAGFTKIKEITVTDNGYAIDKINELEYVNGFIYANVWTTNQLLKIDANTGVVVAKTDMGPLMQDAQKTNPKAMEMNGIAYNATDKTFYITGKMWPKIYKVRM